MRNLTEITQEQKLKAITEKAKEGGLKTPWIVPQENDIFNVLFDHSFAKAYFGDERIVVISSSESTYDEDQTLLNFQYHLQQAVISESPIDYYYDNL